MTTARPYTQADVDARMAPSDVDVERLRATVAQAREWQRADNERSRLLSRMKHHMKRLDVELEVLRTRCDLYRDALVALVALQQRDVCVKALAETALTPGHGPRPAGRPAGRGPCPAGGGGGAMTRCECCGSWEAECMADEPVEGCGCVRCAQAEVERLREALCEAAERQREACRQSVAHLSCPCAERVDDTPLVTEKWEP